MSYVSYPPNSAKPMGPPSVGAAPPILSTSGSFFERYTSGMSAAQVEEWRKCMRAKVAAAGDGKTRTEYFDQCRNQVFGVVQAPSAMTLGPDAAAPAPGLMSRLPPWAVYAGAGVGVFVVVRLLTK